jgi:2'-5' RNA ligase
VDEATFQGLLRLVERKAPPGTGRGVAIVLPVPAADAKKLKVKGGIAADELHLTLTFHGDADDLDEDDLKALKKAIETWVDGKAPIPATVGGIGRFCGPKEDGDAVFATVDAPRLIERHSLVMLLRKAKVPPSMKHGFSPHITVSYVGADDDLPVQRIEPRQIRFDRVELWAGGEVTKFPLTADYDTPEKALREAPMVEQRWYGSRP